MTRCAACSPRDSPQFDLETEDDYVALISHYLEAHPMDQKIRRALEGELVQTTCSECERQYFAPMTVSHQHITVPAYCPRCEQDEPLGGVIVTSLEPRQVVRNAADWGGDLGEQ